jgi:hypothetical protein
MNALELIEKLKKVDWDNKIYVDIVGNGTSVDTVYYYEHHNKNKIYISDYLPKGATEIKTIKEG